MTKTQSLGDWIKTLGCWLLICVAVLCFYDVSGLTTRRALLFPLSGYLSLIFTGVSMQFFGSALPHMQAAWRQE